MRQVSSPTPDHADGVRRAYDTVAEDYAAYLPDTRAESPLDLAMVDAFADAVGPTPARASWTPGAARAG